MAPALPGSWRPSSTTTRVRPRNNCSSFHSGGLTSAITPWLVSVPETAWMSASGSTTTLMPERRRTCASAAERTDSAASTTLHFAIAAQGLFEQVKGLGHTPALLVSAPRAMARRTSFTSGLAALAIVSARAI